MLKLATVFILWNCALSKADTLDEPFDRCDRSNCILKDVYDILVEQKVQMIALRKNAKDVSSKLENYISQMEYYKTKLQTYKSQMDKQNAIVSKVKTNNKRQNQALQALQKRTETAKIEIQKIRQEMDQIKKKRKSISFMGQLKTSTGVSIGRNTILPLNRMYVNEGKGYRVGDRKFHCARSGLYLFSLSVETKNSRLDVSLMKNGRKQGHLLKGTNGNIWGTGSVSAVVRLRYGDTVWALCHQSGLLGQFTFFSGIRISD